MATYKVTWNIDIDANSPNEAAREALVIQRDKESLATYFEVQDLETDEITRIDFTENTLVQFAKTLYGNKNV